MLIPRDASLFSARDVSRISYCAMAVLSVLVAAATLRFFVLPIEVVGEHVIAHEQLRPFAFYGHIIAATLALLVLPVQLSSRLRGRYTTLHRWLGRLYGVSILIGGVSGLILAATTAAGTFAGVGFGLLALLWMFVTWRAVRFAMGGDIARHRKWMIRSAALTFAAVTLRLQLPVAALTVGMDVGYPFIAWTCWVPNALFVEWLLRREKKK